MLSSNLKLGHHGEKLAVAYLKTKSYRIIGTNVRIGKGEIDIVCKKGELYVFVEVKTRTSEMYEDIIDTISSDKEDSLVRCCELYLLENDLEFFDYRIDLIGIVINCNKVIKFEHIKDFS